MFNSLILNPLKVQIKALKEDSMQNSWILYNFAHCCYMWTIGNKKIYIAYNHDLA